MTRYRVTLEVEIPIEPPYSEEQYLREYKRFKAAVKRIWPKANIENYDGLQDHETSDNFREVKGGAGTGTSWGEVER